MRGASIRLLIAVLLFGVWVGWLGYEYATTANPVVVSRPQVLVAPLVIEGQVSADGRVAVIAVYRPRGQAAAEVAVGQEVKVAGVTAARHWQGPGRYFLALQPDAKGTYRLVSPPPSPGFHPEPGAKPVIYPVTPSTRVQLQEALSLIPAEPEAL